MNVLLSYYVARRRPAAKARRRCAVCYRPVKQVNSRNLLKYCCENCRLIARRIMERKARAKKAAQVVKDDVAARSHNPIALSNRRPGFKMIPCSLCGEMFHAPGIYVGDRVVPNVRTCDTCKAKRDQIFDAHDDAALSNPLAMLLDNWHPRAKGSDYEKSKSL